MKTTRNLLGLLLAACLCVASPAGAELIQHLDASVANSVITGANRAVKQWSDLSGKGNHAVERISVVTYPSEITFPGGAAGLDFGTTRNSLELFSADASDQWLDQSAGTGGFAVLMVTHTTASGNDWADLIGNISTVADGFGIRPHQSSGIYQAYMRGQIGQRANVMQVGDTCVWVLNYNAATGAYELWNSKDNNPLTGTRAPVDFSTGNPVTLGTTTAANRFFIGLIGEVMIFDAPLSQAELDQYKSDLVYKWVTPLEEKVMAAVPNPADGLSEVPRDGVGLSWTPGILSTRNDIYLSTDFEAVSSATANNDPAGVYMGRQSANSLALPRLEFGQTYYWRVDAVDGQIYTGPVWSFTTERFSYPLAAQYITAQASSTYENSAPENTINGSGLNAQGLHSTDLGAMWLSDVNDANQAWIQYDFTKPYKLDQMLVWNHNSLVEPLMGWGIKEAEIEYTPDGIEWMSLGIVPFNQAPGMDGYAYNTSTLFDLAVQGVRVRALSNFGGIVRIHMFGLSEVRFLTVPVEAADPSPSDGAAAVPVDTTLNWTAGREALSHELYLSDDLQAVLDETVVPLLLTETGYEVTGLQLGTTYYWKIDEVNEAELAPVWQGNVWSFSTVASIVVDDMESYKDIEGRWIWETWADGFGDPANGATVGHGDLPETQVVHGGTQSLPLSFDNSSSPMSEATRTFDPTQDWARSGIQNLILYVQFSQESTGGEFYVKINGVKIAAVPVAVVQGWSPITVDLAGAGTDLSKVGTLTIGVDGAGAKGVVYVDDIMLMN